MQKKLGFLGYCTCEVGKNPFKIFYGKLGVYMLLLIEVTIYSYYNWYTKNGSHKLTAGFLMSCTYKVKKTLMSFVYFLIKCLYMAQKHFFMLIKKYQKPPTRR